jgi:hypothetical protein
MMTFVWCRCGWVGVGDCFDEVAAMHVDPADNASLTHRTFNQPHMSEDGVEKLLAEAKWGKVPA